MSTSVTFNAIHNRIATVIAFDPKWANGTGYLDHAVKADLGLRPGDIAKSTDNLGRGIVFIGTRFGNVVIFDRNHPGDCARPAKVVGNYPLKLRQFYRGDMGIGTALSEEGLGHLIDPVDGHRQNIGFAIEGLFED